VPNSFFCTNLSLKCDSSFNLRLFKEVFHLKTKQIIFIWQHCNKALEIGDRFNPQISIFENKTRDSIFKICSKTAGGILQFCDNNSELWHFSGHQVSVGDVVTRPPSSCSRRSDPKIQFRHWSKLLEVGNWDVFEIVQSESCRWSNTSRTGTSGIKTFSIY